MLDKYTVVIAILIYSNICCFLCPSFCYCILFACCVYVSEVMNCFSHSDTHNGTHEPSLRSLLSHQRHNKSATVYIKSYYIKTQMIQMIMSSLFDMMIYKTSSGTCPQCSLSLTEYPFSQKQACLLRRL